MSLCESVSFLSLATPGVQKLNPYIPGKPIDELEREYGIANAVKLASNENPLGGSPKALMACRESISNIHLYPDGNCHHLKMALASKFNVDPVGITIGNGSNDVLSLIAQAFLNPSTEALFSQYAFAVYPIVTQAVGAKMVIIAATEDRNGQPFGHDLEKMSQSITRQTRVVFIANPNNPTGTWLSYDALFSFMKSVPDEVIVVIDEAYFEYVSEPDYPDSIQWLSLFSNLIITRTFSKAYGLAGLRVGYAFSCPEIADVLNRVRHPFNVNSLAQSAAVAALSDDDFIVKSAALNHDGIQYLSQQFEQLGLSYIPSVGNFICVNVKSGLTVYDALLHEGIIVRPVDNYQMPEYIRISVGLPEENQKVIHALKKLMR